MAKFSNSNNSLYLNVYIDQSSQNIGANTSTVNWRVTVSRTGAYYTYNQNGDSTLVVTIDGAQVHSSNPRWATSGEEVVLASGSRVINHNADGTKSVSISANFNPNNGVHGRIITSGNLTLSRIPRTSSVASVSGTIGSGVTIAITRQASIFKHTVRYAWGNKSGTIASNVDTSTTWTIPMDFCNDIPNATSGKGTIYVDTYSGSTKIGTSSATLTASVPTSVKPTFTGVSLSDLNSAAQTLIASSTTFIQIISNIKVVFNGATGAYGSRIRGYKAEIVGKNQSTTTNGGSLGLMNYNGAITVRSSVMDSRGRWSDTRDVAVTVLEYFAPILKYDITRSGITSSTFTANRTAKIAPLLVGGVQKNVMTLSFKVAPFGSTTYTTDTGPASGTWTSQPSITTPANLAGTYGADKSFTVIATLSDKFTSTEFAVTVSSERVIDSVYKNGSHAIGKIVDTTLPAGSMETVGGYYVNGKPVQMHQITQNDGNAFNAYSKDLNSVKETGIYACDSNSSNIPSGSGYGYLFVAHHNSSVDYLSQIYLNRANRRMFSRVCENGNWTSWVEYAITDHPNLVNSGWISIQTGVKSKRIGDVVYVDLQDIAVKKQTGYNLGTLPSDHIPSHELMVNVVPWVVNSETVNVQINANGTMQILAQSVSNDRSIRAQFSFAL